MTSFFGPGRTTNYIEGPLDVALALSSPLLINGVQPEPGAEAAIADFGQRKLIIHDGRLHPTNEHEERQQTGQTEFAGSPFLIPRGY